MDLSEPGSILLLTALARQYENQKLASARPANVPSEKQHRERLQSLDSSKYSLAKVIASLESELGQLEGQLAQKKNDLRRFESDDGASLADDSVSTEV